MTRHASLSYAAAEGHINDLLREADAARLAAGEHRESAPGLRLSARLGRRIQRRPIAVGRALRLTGDPLRPVGSRAAPHH